MKTLLTSALFLFVLGNFVQADLLVVSGGIASNYFDDRSPMQTFDGTGLNSPADLNDPTLYTNTGGANNFAQQENWLADGRTANGNPPVGDNWIAYDLGGVATLDVMNIFNLGVSTGGNNARGADAVSIYYRADGSYGNNSDRSDTAFDNAGWTLIADANLAIGSIADDTGALGPDAFDLGGMMASNIAIDVKTTHGDENFIGLGEVQFFGTAVPEPGSSSLLLLGLAMIALRRRNG